MASKLPPAPKPTKPEKQTKASADVRGMTRVYIDLPIHLSQEFEIMAIRRRVSKRVLLAMLVERAVTNQSFLD